MLQPFDCYESTTKLLSSLPRSKPAPTQRRARYKQNLLYLIPFLVNIVGLLLFVILYEFVGSDNGCSFGEDTLAASLSLSQSVFNLDVVYGQFSFGAAKLIDIAFDIIAGRVGQMLYSIFAYTALSAALQMHMEQTPVFYETYASMNLRLGNYTTIWAAIKEARAHRPFRLVLLMLLTAASITSLTLARELRFRIHCKGILCSNSSKRAKSSARSLRY